MISKFLEKSQYCKDDITKIENYEKATADENQIWHLHHRLETHKYKNRSRKEWVKRDENVSAEMLKAFGLYYNRPAEELIFLLPTEHLYLHNKGKKLSKETKRKLSEVNTGKYHTEETKHKLSEMQKGKHLSEDHKQRISKANKGKVKSALSDEHKQRISKAMKNRIFSVETKRKMSEARKKYWELKKITKS